MNKTLGKKKLFSDISANTVQTVISQLFGLAIFYLTSKYLLKNDFGEFNWSMALGSTIIAVASFGLDLLFVKRVASEENTLLISGIHLSHTLIVGIILCSLLLILNFFVPAFSNRHPLFLFVFISLAVANIANSLKLYLNGLESYKQLAVLSLFSNMFKFLIIMLLFLTSYFNIFSLIASFILTSFLEFFLAYHFIHKVTANRVKPLLRTTEYKKFIFQSLPQLGVVIFDSALARVDWIILGILTTAAATAEYSFAYKVFELSKLPILIIAPILLTRFSKLFDSRETLSDKHRQEINFFLRLELFIVMFIPIVLVSTWTPLIDYFTDNKYGAVNEKNYWVLSLCVPLHAVINFLWTMGFVQGQLKVILYVTITVSILNILSNLLMIPAYGTFGASLSFLICTIIQLLLYLKAIRYDQVKLNLKNLVFVFLSAIISIIITKSFINNPIFAVVAAVGIYVFVNLAFKQINLKQLKEVYKK